MDENLRGDQSPLFKQVLGQLLQRDITDVRHGGALHDVAQGDAVRRRRDRRADPWGGTSAPGQGSWSPGRPQATAILAEYGPVRAGGPAGDFGTVKLHAVSGWVVTGHHPDVLTYVAPEDVAEETDLAIGLIGRGNRDRDGRELQVIHVEDRSQ